MPYPVAACRGSRGGIGGAKPSSLLTGLAAYWALNEISNGSGAVLRADSLGVSNLTDHGNSPSAAGVVGLCPAFAGQPSDYFSVAKNTNITLGDIDFTVAAWVKLGTETQGIMTKWGANQLEFALWLQTGTAILMTLSSNGTGVGASATGAVINNLWCLAIGWHDAANNLVGIQINNGTVVTQPIATGVFNGSSRLYIGSMDGTNHPVSAGGGIDEVGLWKRVLTADERAELWNSGAGKTYPFLSGVDGLNGVYLSPYNWRTA